MVDVDRPAVLAVLAVVSRRLPLVLLVPFGPGTGFAAGPRAGTDVGPRCQDVEEGRAAGAAAFHVWFLNQSYSVGFSKSRIGVKERVFTNTQ